MRELFRNSGGYRYLDAYILANIIELGTEHFCNSFLDLQNDPGGRTFSQMTHAARSGCRNFAEGSERIKTSYSTAITLLDVARASLCELRDDYNKWLMLNWEVPWEQQDEKAQLLYGIRLTRPDYGNDINHGFCLHVLTQYRKFECYLSSSNSLERANALLVLINRAVNMLDKYIKKVGVEFVNEGGFRERMTDIRSEARKTQDKGETFGPACPKCGEGTILRKSKKSNQEFWGCRAFPACNGIIDKK